MATSTSLEFDDTTIPARASVTVLDGDNPEFVLVDYRDEHYLINAADLEPLFGARIPPRRYVSADTVRLLRPALDLTALPSRIDADGVTRYDALGYPPDIAKPAFKEAVTPKERDSITVISTDEIEIQGERFYSPEFVAKETGYNRMYLQNLAVMKRVETVPVPRSVLGKRAGRPVRFYRLESVKAWQVKQYGRR